jgi:hypothetical protein
VTGTFSFTATVTDIGNPVQSKSAAFSIVVAATQLSITTSSFAAGTVNATYSQTLQVTGGTPGYTWSIISGALPAGLVLNAASGVISGTPIAPGTNTFIALVTDSSGIVLSKTATFSIVVTPAQLTIITSSLVSGTVSSSYSQTLQASGGTPGYTWSIATGILPGGLTLTSTGTLAGTPTSAGTFTVTAIVTDAGSPAQSTSANFSIVIAPVQLTITTSSLTGGTISSAYSQKLQASGGTPSYKWSIATGSLPAGLTLSQAGTISGSPTSAGTFSFTTTVTDSGSPAQSKSAAFTITIASTQLSITTTSLASGTVNSAYSQTLQASGGTPSYVWSLTSGSLPSGVTLASSGLISGTPVAAGTFAFVASVTDSSSPAQSKSAAFTITIASTQLSITTTSLASGTVNTAYSKTLQASGGTPGYIWNITSGSLPAGLTLAATTGVISGTPTASGTFSFVVTVTDTGSPVQNTAASLSITVAAGTALAITSSSLGGGTTGLPYSQTLQATGGTPGYTWNITTGSLPAGLTLASTTGIISGTPSVAGTFNFTVTVVDNSNPIQNRSLATSIVVATQHGVVLNWNAPTSTTDPVAGYNIYRASGTGGSYAVVNSALNTQTTYTDNAVVSGAVYTYTVKSVDYTNVESVGSNQVTVTIP